MDRLSKARRSENMRHILSRNTLPEIVIRQLVYTMGYRYRLHVKDLPGKPDLVFRPRKKVIFVHGCFWHLHSKCREGRIPSSRVDYWKGKLERNVERDRAHLRRLKQMGWKALIIWECELSNLERLQKRILTFLS